MNENNNDDDLNNSETKEELPEEVVENFKRLFKLTANSLALYAKEANDYQNKIHESKTKPKKDLYQKKFNKVKQKFQDELARAIQLKHIIDENNISLDDEDKEIVENIIGEQEE